MTQTSLDRVFKRVDRIEFSKEVKPMPAAAVVSEVAACPSSPNADHPSAAPSPTSFLLQSIALLAHSLDVSPCMSAVVCTTVLLKVLYCKIKHALFFACFLCIICVKAL